MDLTARPNPPRFHGTIAPIGRIKPKAIINGVKAKLKNGAPTDNLRSKNNSATSGQIVPTKTTKELTAKRMLFITNALSRLTNEKTPLLSNSDARTENRVSAPPIKTPKMIRIKTPRSGSLANAWTDVKTPERTINVPMME